MSNLLTVRDVLRYDNPEVRLGSTYIHGLSMYKLAEEMIQLIDRAAELYGDQTIEIPTPDAEGSYLLDAVNRENAIIKNYAKYTPMNHIVLDDVDLSFHIEHCRFLIMNIFPLFPNHTRSEIRAIGEAIDVWQYLFSTHRSVQLGEFSEKIVVVNGEYGLYSEARQVLLDALSALDQ